MRPAGGRATGAGGRQRLIVAANRGPVSFHAGPSGEPVASRGLGGLVGVLNELLRRHAGTWIAAAMTDEEARLAAGGHVVQVDLEGVPCAVRYVPLDRETYGRYYGTMANPLLWFVQHYLWDLAWHPEITALEHAAWQSYVKANEAFAGVVLEEIGDDGRDVLVMVHDYHLYAVAPLVRRAAPRAFLHHFVHIPWPQSDYWRVLPARMRTALFEGLLGNDVVGFHTERYAASFLAGCVEVLDLPVDRERGVVKVGDRDVWVRWYPVSVDPQSLRRTAGTDDVSERERSLLEGRREFLVVRVDRLDPSKNIIRGFRAFDLFLQRHPEFARRITFLALLQPSREDVAYYAAYRDEALRVADEVNARHGRGDWWPIDLRLQDDFVTTLAAYRQYDVLFVNAVFDGMNLVAKEGCVLNQRDGALILSENTGAFVELGAWALGVNPFDIEEQAEAIHRALTMSPGERRERAVALRDIVQRNDVDRWISAQLADVAAKEAEQ